MANTALNRTGVFLGTNKSGGNLNYGDVVILDNTNNNGFTTTTSGALSTRGIGVIIEPNGIANNATGTVASSGWVPKINLNTSATRGQFLKTHTVAGQATPHDSPQVEGDFGVVLDITSASAPTAWLFGSPNQSSTGGTITTTGSPASGEMAQFSGATSITGVASPGNICEGRLTTESGVPISTTDRTGQGTLYFTPCSASGIAIGTGQISLYNGTRLVLKTFTELSLALTVSSGKNYDVFVDYNAGTPQLVLSAAWTTDTARADALATQAGIVVKSGTTAYRWVGTIRADGANTIADSGGITGTTQVGGKRFVWNAYNQVSRQNTVIDTTDSWSYTTNTIRQANGAAGNKVEWVTGNAATLVDAEAKGTISELGNSTLAAKIGVGIDSTSTFSGLVQAAYNNNASRTYGPAAGRYVGYPGLGYHFASWNEKGADGTSCIFNGDNGGDSSQAGLVATMWG